MICDVGSAFGPDYAHHEGTAFGFYASGFGHLESGDELQSDPGRSGMTFQSVWQSEHETCVNLVSFPKDKI